MGIYAELNQQKSNDSPHKTIVLRKQRAATIPLVILGVLMVFSLLFPITIIILISGNGFHPKFLFSVALASIPGIYFTRLFLWNRYGAEILEITENGVHLWNDYRLFRGNKRILKGKTIHFALVDYEKKPQPELTQILDTVVQEKGKNARLLLFNDQEQKCITDYHTTIDQWAIILQEANDSEGKLAQLIPVTVEEEEEEPEV